MCISATVPKAVGACSGCRESNSNSNSFKFQVPIPSSKFKVGVGVGVGVRVGNCNLLRGGKGAGCGSPHGAHPPQGDLKSIKISSNQLRFSLIFSSIMAPFGFQFGAKIDPKSIKVRLRIAFEKTTEKYTF